MNNLLLNSDVVNSFSRSVRNFFFLHYSKERERQRWSCLDLSSTMGGGRLGGERWFVKLVLHITWLTYEVCGVDVSDRSWSNAQEPDITQFHLKLIRVILNMHLNYFLGNGKQINFHTVKFHTFTLFKPYKFFQDICIYFFRIHKTSPVTLIILLLLYCW